MVRLPVRYHPHIRLWQPCPDRGPPGFADAETVLDVWFNFSADYSVVWVDNTVKPSLSYRVKAPGQVKSMFAQRFADNSVTMEIGSAALLWKERTPYIGNNAAVGTLVSLLPVPDGLTYRHLKLHTDTVPYAVEIVYTASPETLARYEMKGLFKSPPLPNNALVLLALIDNADRVIATITADTKETSLVLGRDWVEDAMGLDVRAYADSPERIQELMELSVTLDAVE